MTELHAESIAVFFFYKFSSILPFSAIQEYLVYLYILLNSAL